MEYGTDGIRTVFHRASPSKSNICIIHTKVTAHLAYCHDLTNRIGVPVMPDEQGTKKNFIEAQARPNATPMEWGSSEDDSIREMIEALEEGQKAHSRKLCPWSTWPTKARIQPLPLCASSGWNARLFKHLTANWQELPMHRHR